jgi:hypothetical protein
VGIGANPGSLRQTLQPELDALNGRQVLTGAELDEHGVVRPLRRSS